MGQAGNCTGGVSLYGAPLERMKAPASVPPRAVPAVRQLDNDPDVPVLRMRRAA